MVRLQPVGCRDMLAILVLLLGNGIFGEEAETLMCDCTEQECLSGGSAMCRTTSANGCYKEYFSGRDPPVVMGCMSSLLLCDQDKMRPQGYSDSWPYTACCFTNHCNRHLRTPYDDLHRNATNTTTQKMIVTKPATAYAITDSSAVIVTAGSLTDSNTNSGEDDSVSESHPVFLLLIVLVIFFLLVVVASILVIIKIWFYRRCKPKEMTVWKVSQQNLPDCGNAQRSCLLTRNSSSDSSRSSQQTSTNTLLETFDVP